MSIKTRSHLILARLLAQGFVQTGAETRRLNHGGTMCCCWDDGYCGDCHRGAVYEFFVLAPPAGMTPGVARKELRKEIMSIHKEGHRTNNGGWYQRG